MSEQHLTYGIKGIYSLLFILVVLQPHFIGHIFPVLPVYKPYIESTLTLVIAGTAYLMYRFHQRLMLLQAKKLHISNDKLLDAFQYIGAVNRKVPMIKNISSNLLAMSKWGHKNKKDIFEQLLMTATVSIAKAPMGLLRFMEIASLRTIKEFVYPQNQPIRNGSSMGNKALAAHQSSQQYMDDVTLIVPTSDQENAVRAFLIFPNVQEQNGTDPLMLQAIVDQAQLFYKYVYY